MTDRLPGDRRRIPNGCWCTAHLPTAISKLSADRSVNYLVDEVRRVGRSWRMRCHGAARTSRLALDCPRWRVVHWTAGDGRLVPASRVAWVRAAGHAGQGCGELWRGGDARSVAGGAVLGVVSRSSAAGAGRAGSVSDSAVRLGEHSSCVPCQPPGGTRRPNRLVESRVEPLVRTRCTLGTPGALAKSLDTGKWCPTYRAGPADVTGPLQRHQQGACLDQGSH